MGWSHRLQAFLYKPPRVRNLLVRALRAAPRGNKFQQNRRLWDVAHLFGGGESGHRRDATTKPGLLRGPGWDPTPVGWDRIWPDGFGWHIAEQAALEVDRVVRLGRPVRNRQSLATHFARCFARPQQCHRTTPRRLRRHPTQPAPRPPPRRKPRHPNPTQRQFPDRTDSSPEPGYRTQTDGSGHRSRTAGHRPGTARSSPGSPARTASHPTRPPRNPTPDHSEPS